MKRFRNKGQKVNIILSAFKSNEKLKNKEIYKKIYDKGYKITEIHLRMYIYHNMLYKYLKKEKVKGVNYYSLIKDYDEEKSLQNTKN